MIDYNGQSPVLVFWYYGEIMSRKIVFLRNERYTINTTLYP